MSKPRIDTILKIIDKKEKAKALLEEVEIETKKLIDRYGESRFDYEIEPTKDENGKVYSYLKFELIDNLRKMEEGEPVVGVTYFKSVEFRKSFLIRMPESLK